jgi:RND family efflux transporter MFP subunit
MELFVEMPPLVAGRPSEVAVHLTRLSDFAPVADGTLRLTLAPLEPLASASGSRPADGAALIVTAAEPSRPGLFRLRLTPSQAAAHRLVVALISEGQSTRFELKPILVHADMQGVTADALSRRQSGDGVMLSKEQQWQADFATAVVERRRLRGSVPATGVLRPSADGEAHLTAPIDGHLRSAPGGFPFTGMAVEAGQIIAYLVPQLGGETDVAGLELAVTRAESQLDLARQERERLDALWQDRSIAYRDVLQARSAEQVAEAELTAARRRLAQVRRTAEGEAAGVPVRAPIAGVVARVAVAPGGFVEEGDRLFHIVDRRRVWLEARVAEADIGRIREPDGAWFQVPGLAPDPTRVFEVAPRTGARLVAYGAMVDPESRTVPVIFELPLPDDRLRVGLSVTARVLTGEVEDTLAVPAGALVNDAGADVVYVQTAGERFERRLVRTGLRDGDFVGIRGGLQAGERVVSRGAYLVHLAAGAEPAQGHHHGHDH